MMVRVVGNTAKRQPCGLLLIAEVPPDNFNARLVAAMGQAFPVLMISYHLSKYMCPHQSALGSRGPTRDPGLTPVLTCQCVRR